MTTTLTPRAPATSAQPGKPPLGHRVANSALAVLVAAAALVGPPAEPDVPSHFARGFSHAQEALIEWAIGRFADAGLELPPLEFVHYPTREPCRGARGLYTGDRSRATIRICVREASPFAELLLLHEIAHAWDGYALTDGRPRSVPPAAPPGGVVGQRLGAVAHLRSRTGGPDHRLGTHRSPHPHRHHPPQRLSRSSDRLRPSHRTPTVAPLHRPMRQGSMSLTARRCTEPRTNRSAPLALPPARRLPVQNDVVHVTATGHRTTRRCSPTSGRHPYRSTDPGALSGGWDSQAMGPRRAGRPSHNTLGEIAGSMAEVPLGHRPGRSRRGWARARFARAGRSWAGHAGRPLAKGRFARPQSRPMI